MGKRPVGRGGGEGLECGFEIRVPDWRILRIVARSVLLTLAVIAFSKTSLFRGGNTGAVSVSVSVTGGDGDKYMDDVIYLPMLFRDLKREGIFRPETGKAVFLAGGENQGRYSLLLKRNKLDPVTPDRWSSTMDDSVDFVFSADGTNADLFDFVDRVLKTGGIVAVRFNSLLSASLRFPSNYKPVYIRRLRSTIVAMQKIYLPSNKPTVISIGRKLRSIPESKQEALTGLEDVLLEPPRVSSRKLKNLLKRTKFLTGDTLAGYPRRFFVDVGPPNGNPLTANNWFEKHYPTRYRRFEIVRLEERDDDAGEVEELAWWLWRNVGEVVEALVSSGGVGLVDELFLECGVGRKRAYWECLALYGRLRDEGVAVHQWWG